MYKSNDCIKLTKQHLRNYKYYVTALENITEDIKCIELELQNQSIKATEYGNIPGGGGSELSTTEQAAELRIKLTQEKEDLIQKRKELQRQVNKIDRSMAKLPEEEREIVNLFYIQRMSYDGLSQRTHYGERRNRKMLREAEQHLAIMFYGIKADEDVFFFN